MPLEAATYISELVPANPVGGVDLYSTADDHLRLLKSVLQGQFPNFSAAAVLPTVTELNKLVGATFVTADLNLLTGLQAAGLSNAELAFVNGVTSAIQTQLDSKAAFAHAHAGTDITSGQVAVANGGTGAANAGGARTNLGIGTIATRGYTASTSGPSGGADGDIWDTYV